MSRILKFPDRRLRQEQATTWIARLDRGLRGSEQQQLQEWLAEDARHRDALLEVAQLWDRMDVLADLAELFPLQHETVAGRWSSAWLAAAALVAVAGALVTWTEFRLRTGHRAGDAARAVIVAAQPTSGAARAAPESTPFVASYSTAVGEQRTVTLPDHSTIRLNTNTAVRVQYTATARLLEMARGEANFEVAKDPARLFTVRVGGFDFNAVGTAFNIRADTPRGVRLTVTQGRVRIHRAPQKSSDGSQTGAGRPEVNDITEVEANKEVVIGQSSERIEALRLEQVAVATAWQRGMLAFDATPLQEVVAELSRYTTTRFVIEDPAIGRVPVSGYFRIGDLDALSTALQQNFGVDIRNSGEVVHLSARAER